MELPSVGPKMALGNWRGHPHAPHLQRPRVGRRGHPGTDARIVKGMAAKAALGHGQRAVGGLRPGGPEAAGEGAPEGAGVQRAAGGAGPAADPEGGPEEEEPALRVGGGRRAGAGRLV